MLTDAELLRDAHLDDALAGCELAIEDLFDKLIANLVPQNPAFAARRLCSWLCHLADPFGGSAYATYALTGAVAAGCSDAASCPTMVDVALTTKNCRPFTSYIAGMPREPDGHVGIHSTRPFSESYTRSTPSPPGGRAIRSRWS